MRRLDSTANGPPETRGKERPTTLAEGHEEEERCTATINMSSSPACALESSQPMYMADIDSAANCGSEPLQPRMSPGFVSHSNTDSSSRKASQNRTFSPKEERQGAGSTCSTGGETTHLSSIACPRKSALQQDAGAPDGKEAVLSEDNFGSKEDRRRTFSPGSTLAKGPTATDKPSPGRTISHQVGEGSTYKAGGPINHRQWRRPLFLTRTPTYTVVSVCRIPRPENDGAGGARFSGINCKTHCFPQRYLRRGLTSFLSSFFIFLAPLCVSPRREHGLVPFRGSQLGYSSNTSGARA